MLEKKETKFIIAAISSIIYVFFTWGFWENGVSNLGINATIFGFFIIALMLSNTKNLKNYLKKYWYFIIPLILIISNFALYSSEFLKTINIYILPLLILISFGIPTIQPKGEQNWSFLYIDKLITRKPQLKEANKELKESINGGNSSMKEKIEKIIIGLLILGIINSVIITILVNTDASFAKFVNNTIGEIDIITVIKILFTVPFFFLLIAIKKTNEIKTEFENKLLFNKLDPIISGIILGGTLISYILFIGVNINSWLTKNIIGITQIATDTKYIFWQIFTIAVINIFFFIIFNKKSTKIVQNILLLFSISSLFILFIAMQKMQNYIGQFGLSYEKFFAYFTIIFLAIIFAGIITSFFIKNKIDTLKLLFISTIWFYAIANLLPIDKIIYEYNYSLYNKNESNDLRLIYQNHMLSNDIKNILPKNELYFEHNWHEWTANKIFQKKWYEKNFGD